MHNQKCHPLSMACCRPTQPAHFWPDHPSILAGRDVLRQGTWLGVTRTGRVALLTNYRERLPSHATTQATEDGGDVVSGASFVKTTNAPSRGALTANFLTGSASPLEYLQVELAHTTAAVKLTASDCAHPTHTR